jgi:hypothetical protein
MFILDLDLDFFTNPGSRGQKGTVPDPGSATLLTLSLLITGKRRKEIFSRLIFLNPSFYDSFNTQMSNHYNVSLLPVLIVTAIKDLFEDRRRYKSDKRVNNSCCRVFRQAQQQLNELTSVFFAVGIIVPYPGPSSVPTFFDLIICAIYCNFFIIFAKKIRR